MSYSQDRVPRRCTICNRNIQEFELMLDLFRKVGKIVEWVHEACAKNLLEVVLTKKRDREAKEKHD